MTDRLDNSQLLDYFETIVQDFIIERLSSVPNWWNSCIPPEIRKNASQRYEGAKKVNNILNKPDYEVTEYINFDGYGKIISRRDNWKAYFEEVFLDKSIFEHKMQIILSLRNDIRHGRQLNAVNSLRLRLHCYDILSQIYETIQPDTYDRNSMLQKLGLKPD